MLVYCPRCAVIETIYAQDSYSDLFEIDDATVEILCMACTNQEED